MSTRLSVAPPRRVGIAIELHRRADDRSHRALHDCVVPGADSDGRADFALDVDSAPDRTRFGEPLELELGLGLQELDSLGEPRLATCELARITGGDRRRDLVGAQPLLEPGETYRGPQRHVAPGFEVEQPATATGLLDRKTDRFELAMQTRPRVSAADRRLGQARATALRLLRLPLRLKGP